RPHVGTAAGDGVRPGVLVEDDRAGMPHLADVAVALEEALGLIVDGRGDSRDDRRDDGGPEDRQRPDLATGRGRGGLARGRGPGPGAAYSGAACPRGPA